MTKELIMVGDKVLIEPNSGDNTTDGGLFLPQGIKEKEKVQYGKIVKIGPGYPVPDSSGHDQEPWSKSSDNKYFSLQASEGDFCIYLRDHVYEIQYEKKKFFVAPHSAILVLIKDSTKIAGVTL